MEPDRLTELHKEALALAEDIRHLEHELATWRTKGDIQEELSARKSLHAAIVDEVTGLLSVPEERADEGGD